MTVRSIEEIERAFREMGIAVTDSGGMTLPPKQPLIEPTPQVFFRIETNTDPLEGEPDADLA